MSRDEILAQSFARVPFSRADLHAALCRMGPDVLISRTARPLARGVNLGHTSRMKAAWSPENPTRNCCYFVTEAVFWYCAPAGSRPMGIKVAGDEGTHRFVEWADGTIVDVTRDQYPAATVVDYSRAKGMWFLPAHTRTAGGGYVRGQSGPSKRATTLAALLHLTTIIPKPAQNATPFLSFGINK